ncbi:formylmethanofuran dehydrogenase subunit E family protein [Bacteroidota bacterium]
MKNIVTITLLYLTSCWIIDANEFQIGFSHNDDRIKYDSVESVVFNEFPHDPELFKNDLQIYMDSIIQKYGELEWKTCVITNEFHGHLGIYSLIGAKMGIKAREILFAPIDRLEVISFAGNRPPISCFTDGLQVSTGATLGQGTITVSSEQIKRPEAIFIYNQDSIKMKLKDEYWNIIKDDISNGIVEYGLQTDGYWKLIRKLAIKYWHEFNRNEIFEIIKL